MDRVRVTKLVSREQKERSAKENGLNQTQRKSSRENQAQGSGGQSRRKSSGTFWQWPRRRVLRIRYPFKHPFSGLSHLTGAVLSLVGLLVLIVASAGTVYGAGNVEAHPRWTSAQSVTMTSIFAGTPLRITDRATKPILWIMVDRIRTRPIVAARTGPSPGAEPAPRRPKESRFVTRSTGDMSRPRSASASTGTSSRAGPRHAIGPMHCTEAGRAETRPPDQLFAGAAPAASAYLIEQP